MASDPSACSTNPYRVLIEDRLAFVASANDLDSVLEDLGRRLSSIPDRVADADVAVWRDDRIEAIIVCRPGRAFSVTRPVAAIPPRVARRPRTTIGTLMLVVLGCALILAALRTSAGIDLLKSTVMIGLMAAIVGSSVATLYYTLAFLRDEGSSRG